MRILLLSNTPFLPTTAGNRARIRNMIEYLQERGAEIAMLMLPEVDRATWDEPGMRARLAHFAVLAPSGTVRAVRGARHRLAGLLGRGDPDPSEPIPVDAWCPPWFRREAARFARAWRPNAVLAEYVFLSACLEDVRGVLPYVLGVIDTHDVMHARPAVYAAAGLSPRWFHTSVEEERKGLARADLILAMHEAEAAVLRRMVPERTVLTVPHGHPVRPAPPSDARPGRLLLVASYNDLNVAGLRWLLDEVWPSVRQALPDAELSVCGTIAEKVRSVPPGVSLSGVVPALDGEYARARVVVNPVPAATGLQVKTIEALCHGRPVVSTSRGAAGIDAAEAGVVVADAAADFAAGVVRLLVDDVLWRQLASDTAAYARRRLSPAVAFAPLVDHFQRTAKRAQCSQ